MKISEIFYSIQGEIDVGKPAIFIRLSGCNLIKKGKGCFWCDTKYAELGKEMSVESVIEMVDKINCQTIIITGGEPFLQSGELLKLIGMLTVKGHKIYIETNGTLLDDYNVASMILIDGINCSPKRQEINFKVLKALLMFGNIRFKFVYQNRKDLWWEKVIKKLNIPKQRVWIMPEGKNEVEQIGLMAEVIEYCKRTGYNFTPRLQALVYNGMRGV